MVTIENRVGRLVESRRVSPVGVADVEAVRAGRQPIQSTLGDQRIACMDFPREHPVMTQGLAERMGTAIRARPRRSLGPAVSA